MVVVSDCYESDRDWDKGNPKELDTDTGDILTRRKGQIESAARQGLVDLTMSLCHSLQRVALENVRTARVFRDRNLKHISDTEKYVDDHFGAIPASEIVEMIEQLDSARQESWATFRGHKNYYKNYLPDFIEEQLGIANSNVGKFGQYFARSA